MGRKPAIDRELGIRLIQEYQRLGSRNAAARALGVSPSAASRFFRGLPAAGAPAVRAREQVVESAVGLLEEARATLAAARERLELRAAELEAEIKRRPWAMLGREDYIDMDRQLREHAPVAADIARMFVDVDTLRVELSRACPPHVGSLSGQLGGEREKP